MNLLATKLRIPPLRPALVPRERLLARLDETLTRPLALVTAPAGFGKTTLVAAWAAGCGRPVAWLSLDEADADPARFLTYLVAALQQVVPGIGQTSLALLGSPRPLEPPAVLLPLVAELEEVPGDFVLVLDDYHLAACEAIDAAVTFLLDHQPPALHVLVAARADPALPVPRLRARGQLVELRQADLCFTPEEAEAFLRQSAGAPLTPEQAGEIARQAEGWIAGLQMAAASLQGRDAARVDAFVQAFAGTHRHILDYLSEEVLRRQPPETQAFLRQTSVLERLSGPLCAAVTGRADSQAALEGLERANLFISALDDRREWFRYHRLFADLLRHRLQQAEAESIPALHRRASAWLEGHGDTSAAVEHALAAQDFARAADLIESAAAEHWKRGEVNTVQKWLAALPGDFLRTRAVLCAYYAAGLVLSTRSLAQAQQLTQAAAAAHAGSPLPGEVLTLQAFFAMLAGDLQHGIDLSREALAALPENSPFRDLSVYNLSSLHLLRLDVDAAEELLKDASRVSLRIGDRLGAAVAWRRLGTLSFGRGRLRQAWALYQRALDLCLDARGRPWPLAGRVLIHLGELQLEWNDLEAAESYLEEGMRLAAEVIPGWNMGGYVSVARLRQARGDAAGARAALEQARQLARESEYEIDDQAVDAYAARLAITQGDPDAARRWAAQLAASKAVTAGRPGQDVEALLYAQMYHEFEQMVLARVYLATGQPREALAILTPLLAPAEQLGRIDSLVEILILQAFAQQALGDGAAALALLTRALALAEPEGFVRLFADEGPALATLLARIDAGSVDALGVGALSVDALLAYRDRLLTAFEGGREYPNAQRGHAQRETAQRATLPESLSERELEVLCLIAGGLTNAEIAAKLFLSLSTVKVHTYNLYGKLGVHSRTQAVARAQALGLLPAA